MYVGKWIEIYNIYIDYFILSFIDSLGSLLFIRIDTTQDHFIPY